MFTQKKIINIYFYSTFYIYILMKIGSKKKNVVNAI